MGGEIVTVAAAAAAPRASILLLAYRMGATIREALESAGDYLFRVAEPIDGGRIDPVHAGIEGGADGAHRFGIVLRSPAEGPTAAADGPGANAEGGNHQVTVAKLPFLHRFSG